MNTHSDNLAQVRARLAPEAHLLSFFDRLFGALAATGEVGLAASGSLAKGPIDRWSDLDLEVVLRPGDSVAERLRWTTDVATSVAPPLCHFPASHVGLDQILVFFFLDEDALVKADLYVVELDTFLGLEEPLLLHDPGFILSAPSPAPSPPPPPDFEDLDMKFCGWIWYTHTKIARGELWEAADSLQVMRNRALLPSLQCARGTPYEGNRRLESRLPPEDLDLLSRTWPSSLEPGELTRALLEMAAGFAAIRPEVARRLGRDHRRAQLDSMIRHVRRQ